MKPIIKKTRIAPFTGTLLVSLLSLLNQSHADTTYSANASGAWHDAGTWLPGGLPGLIDTAIIGDGYIVTVNDTQSISSLNLSIASDSAGSLVVDASGHLTADALVHLGTAAGAHGTLTVNTGGVFASTLSDGLVVGHLHGAGVLNVDGGTVTSSGAAYIGNFGTATGTVNVTGGSWTGASSVSLGRDNGATGFLNISGGSVGTSTINMGVNAGSEGTITVSDTGALSTGGIVIGNGGVGRLNLTGGSITSTGVVVGNAEVTGSGTANVSAGTWNTGDVTLGNSGTGVLTLGGGTITSSGGATLGSLAGSQGMATTTGGRWDINSALTVGSGGTGELNIDGGNVTVASNIEVAETAGSNGTVTVTDGALEADGQLTLGSRGTGTLNLVGGEVNVGETLYVATVGGSSGVVNFGTGTTTGTLIVGTADVIGGAGTATVNFNHTENHASNLNFKGYLSVNQIGEGTTTLNGENTYVGATSVSSGTLHIASSGTLSDTSEIIISGGAFTIGAANRISNTAGMTLSGGTFGTGGFSDTLGILTLADSSTSYLDFGAGESVILFSGMTEDTGILVVTNWTAGSDSLRFTSDENLRAGSFLINGKNATIVNHGSYYEVVEAIPEPGAYVLVIGGAAILGLTRRYRA